ncbi:hypothetical protein [Nonomuraea sp. JJY05]|uniref:hypothetical protein n=1 Tax=Nonomuraea sp. JJY05 TaxID=3350255 RepID=UPI00373F0AE0
MPIPRGHDGRPRVGAAGVPGSAIRRLRWAPRWGVPVGVPEGAVGVPEGAVGVPVSAVGVPGGVAYA